MATDCLVIAQQSRDWLAEFPSEDAVTPGFAFRDLPPFGVEDRDCCLARCDERWWHLRQRTVDPKRNRRDQYNQQKRASHCRPPWAFACDREGGGERVRAAGRPWGPYQKLAA